MTPHVIGYAPIPEEDLKLLTLSRRLFELVPDMDLGNVNGEKILPSCHIVSRAFAKVLKLKCVDGEFGGGFRHTWLLTPNGNILDIVPVGVVGGPILVHNGRGVSPGKFTFEPQRLKPPIGISKPEYKKAVAKLTKAIRKVMKESKSA